jgi:hypothetical protein
MGCAHRWGLMLAISIKIPNYGIRILDYEKGNIVDEGKEDAFGVWDGDSLNLFPGYKQSYGSLVSLFCHPGKHNNLGKKKPLIFRPPNPGFFTAWVTPTLSNKINI